MFSFPDLRVLCRDLPHRRVAIAGESQDWWEHVETLKEDTRFDLVMGYRWLPLHLSLITYHVSRITYHVSRITRPLEIPITY